ncbi:Eukaryotic peptide chain release factor GTP-binding subunit [Saitozyma sp. JCM 24511]|nr:Eukaryotic peptide chain release factor GTP-binding subunit [Saitozyma sp. JCM 24511]
MSGPPGFNPGAFEFRPGQQAFVPRSQQQQQQQPGQPQQGQGFDPYAAYGQQAYQQGYQQQYNQYGGYPQYGHQQGGYGGYPGAGMPQQQAYAPPQQRAYQPPVRQVQGFQPPNVGGGGERAGATPPPSGRVDAGKPVSLSIGGGGAPKPAPSLSIGGAGPAKPAPSLSIGGGPAKPAPSLSIGGGGGPAKPAPSLSIGGAKKEDKTETPKKAEPKDEAAPAPIPAPAPAPAAAATPKPAAAPAVETPPTVPSPAPEPKLAPVSAGGPPGTDAQAKVLAGQTGSSAASTPASKSGTATPTNFSKVSAKNDAEAIYKEQAAAGAEAMRDLYGGEDKDPNVKSHLNIIFAGHVDAGKSTMGGQLLFLTGAVDKRTMEKYEQEAKAAGRDTWYLSWALDSGKEERAKGKTVEVGRAYFETEKRRYTILDAPGHKTYVPSMISGAAQADVAMLVLSARKGEFETGFEREGQTREHAVLLKNNGINKLVLVVNKMDDPTVQWDKARFDEICAKITPFLKALGFNPKTDLTFIPVSAQVGENMKDRVDKKIAPWYEGPSLLEFLDNLTIMDRDINAPFMLPVSEKYVELGTMVMGKIESGRVKKGDALLLMPNKSQVEVAGIFTESAEEIDVAFCGDNIRLRLRGVADEDVQPGYVLTSTKNPVKAVTAFKADLSILETKNIITGGFSCVLHVHTLSEEVTISALLHYFERKTRRKSKKPPQFAKTGMLVSALIETSAPICIEKFDDYRMLGRFTLRDEGRTIAIGKVTKLIESKESMPDVASLSVAA